MNGYEWDQFMNPNEPHEPIREREEHGDPPESDEDFDAEVEDSEPDEDEDFAPI